MTALRRALSRPTAQLLVGGLTFWAPYGLWLLMPDWFVGDRSEGSVSLVVLAPVTVWVATYCWYRFILPAAPQQILPAIRMGIVGPLMSSWLGAWLVLLMKEIQDRKLISVDLVLETGVVAPFEFLSSIASIGMLMPLVVVVIGSRFVGRALSGRFEGTSGQGQDGVAAESLAVVKGDPWARWPMADENSVLRAWMLVLSDPMCFLESAPNRDRDTRFLLVGLASICAALVAVPMVLFSFYIFCPGHFIVSVLVFMLTPVGVVLGVSKAIRVIADAAEREIPPGKAFQSSVFAVLPPFVVVSWSYLTSDFLEYYRGDFIARLMVIGALGWLVWNLGMVLVGVFRLNKAVVFLATAAVTISVMAWLYVVMPPYRAMVLSLHRFLGCQSWHP